MKISKGPIIVPWDFTEEVENALKHALNITHKVNKDITLLHIVRRKKDVEKYNDKLEVIAREWSEEYNVNIHPVAIQGNLFTAIGKYADNVDAEIVVMGTHGIKGMQKIVGSRALKVIAHSRVPFIVVKHPPKNSEYKRVVFPVDHRKKTKQKMQYTKYLSSLYNPKFLVFKPNYTDKGFIQKAKANLSFCTQFMNKHEMNYEMYLTEGKKSFSEELTEFAKKSDADLIMIVSAKHLTLTDYVAGPYEQYIIGNEEGIPVMVINPPKGLEKFKTFN
ncbi:MAG: universal stress protein [Bacteroidales bacterium]